MKINIAKRVPTVPTPTPFSTSPVAARVRFALQSTLMLEVRVIQHFKWPSSRPGPAPYFGMLIVYFGTRPWGVKKADSDGSRGEVFSFRGSLGQSGGYVPWIRTDRLEPSENSMSKEIIWHPVIDRWIFLLKSTPLSLPYSVWPWRIEKRIQNKIKQFLLPLLCVRILVISALRN